MSDAGPALAGPSAAGTVLLRNPVDLPSSSAPVVPTHGNRSAGTQPRYRREIDGLRAIAVMSVLLYHAGIDAIGAGFLGVDIFFVISGYLITGIILGGLERGEFSILDFYERRARRILPALLAVCLLAIIPAWFLMLPEDVENLSESIVATILFANNVLLFLSSDYFDLDNEFKPLMHTWSLGIEEQYYVVVPVAMYLLYRLRRRSSMLIGIGALTAASFAFAIWAAQAAPRANFYLLPSRAWELGAGALVTMALPHARDRLDKLPGAASALALAGLAMIVVPMLLLAGDASMPSWPTLVPVAGTCLVLLFAGSSDPAGRLLSSGPFVAVGLISYSAYLIHQPVFAFVRVASLSEPSKLTMTGLLVPVLLAAYTSWRWIERPFRDSRRVPVRRMVVVLGGGSVLTIAAGLALYLSSGLHGRWPDLAADRFGVDHRANNAFNLAPERYLGLGFPAVPRGAKVLVVGDSFARDFINMGLATGALSGAHLSLSHDPLCPGTLSDAIGSLARKADVVVLSTRFKTEDVRCIARRVEALRAIGAQVVVVGNKSFGWSNSALMLLPPDTRYRYRTLPLHRDVLANQEASRHFSPAIYVDPIALVGDARGRVPVFTPERKWISQDRTHVTMAGARYVGEMVFRHPALRAIAGAPRASDEGER